MKWKTIFHTNSILDFAQGIYIKTELGTLYLKSSGAAACRYLNKKVAPLPLLAYKTAAAAATLEKYQAKRTMAFRYGTH